MKISHTALSKEALDGIIEEYVSREGTDYGDRVYSLAEKVEHVMGQIEKGEVLIEFDADSQSCQLLSKDQLQCGADKQ
jgi:uncharacterized protein YheU (UPF0270 family)